MHLTGALCCFLDFFKLECWGSCGVAVLEDFRFLLCLTLDFETSTLDSVVAMGLTFSSSALRLSTADSLLDFPVHFCGILRDDLSYYLHSSTKLGLSI